DADWAPIMRLVHDRAPSSAELTLMGQAADRFRLTGALNVPDLDLIRRLRAEPMVNWDGGDLFGLELGGGTMRATLDDGLLLLRVGSVLERHFTGEMMNVRMSDLNFSMDGGRIGYDNFTMYVMDNDLDLRFSGSIGFEGDVNMTVSVPVRSGLLDRFGVRGP